MKRVAIFIATAGYSGYAPVAPGTVGSAAGILVWVVTRPWASSTFDDLVLIAILTAVGIWSATIAERHFGGTDPGPIVIDEVVGMLITLLSVPVGWPAAVTGFFVFRAFDIIKPFPAGRLERLHGGSGVMADDMMAAVYANLTMRAILWLLAA
ncbi:MAG: phosphatidylglycerophosphatase A [Acidobacteria bacterium]|nr:phosphatidylglycerophosphatase A [Acidobacteriota bacterium]